MADQRDDDAIDFSIYEVTDDPVDATDPETMTALANEFWSKTLVSASDRAEMDQMTAVFAAFIHPQHPTIQ